MSESDKGHAAKPRLGRGLSSLISTFSATEHESGYTQEVPTISPSSGKATIGVGQDAQPNPPIEIPVEDIAGNPFQPRRDFPSEELAGLAASIARHGVLQPIRVTKSSDPAARCPYTLIAGERRLRAAKLAGLKAVPCVVSPASQEQMIQWAIIENVQRSDLNPIERAQAYRQVLDRFGISQAELAESLGEPRTTIANYLRILDLHEEVRDLIASGALSFGHAKVLAGLVGNVDVQIQIARKAAAQSLSVRQLEDLIAAASAGDDTGEREPAAPRVRPAYLRDIEERLSAAIGTRVMVLPGRKKNTGRIVLEYYGLEDFDRISALLGVRPEDE